VGRMREEQGGRCAICGRATERLLVDHCHVTGCVRGLLCYTCNTFLGWYEAKADTILQFQAYLAGRSEV
jgi:Recombination endonuclease VII